MITSNEVKQTKSYWTEFAKDKDNKCFDISIMKIWIKFEQFIGDLFVTYATGQPSRKRIFSRFKY